jgi:hypothetical protein
VHVAFSDTLKAQQFQHFLERLLARYKDAGKILLVLDNARAHHSKELELILNKLNNLGAPPENSDNERDSPLIYEESSRPSSKNTSLLIKNGEPKMVENNLCIEQEQENILSDNDNENWNSIGLITK